jgi:phytol kinase
MPDPVLLPPATVLLIAALSGAYVVLAGSAVGSLRLRRGMRAPYTRKIFHFLILSAAAAVHWFWQLPGVLLYGSVVSASVLYAVYRGDGFAMYEALARPSDAPRRALFVVVPLVTTAVGGLLANLLFGDWAAVGYLVVAWGDAVGEPVGARWGRHPYRVPSLGGVAAQRTLEGSFAVLVASTLAAGAALLAFGVPVDRALGVAVVVGVGAAAVEAVSHHGLDNFTVQLAAAGLAALLLPGGQ